MAAALLTLAKRFFGAMSSNLAASMQTRERVPMSLLCRERDGGSDRRRNRSELQEQRRQAELILPVSVVLVLLYWQILYR
jgi:hypothetical protein